MKVTNHSHRIKLLWDSIFFLYDGKGDEQSSYYAAVETKGYYFERYTEANLRIRSPAQQVVWSVADAAGKVVLSPYAQRWLETNLGPKGPEWYVREEPFDQMLVSVLFRRRKDALSFVNFIKAELREETE